MNLGSLAQGIRPTVLLYQEDSYLKEASCGIVRSEPDDRKSGYVVLDRSAFHPKSGGQPSDRGKISADGVVFDVRRVMMSAGVVIHWGKYVQGVPAVGPAHMEMDWGLRHRLMRKHTAAHLYDHCLSTVLGKHVETTDSWVGDDGYIGYRGRLPSKEQLQTGEVMENQMIANGARVASALMTREEAFLTVPDAPNMARLPSNTNLRVVTIEGCHGIPCGGTHLRDAREIGRFLLKAPKDLTEGFRVYFDISP